MCFIPPAGNPSLARSGRTTVGLLPHRESAVSYADFSIATDATGSAKNPGIPKRRYTAVKSTTQRPRRCAYLQRCAMPAQQGMG
jgi:hypothetical protein